MNPHTRERERTKTVDSTRLSTMLESREPRGRYQPNSLGLAPSMSMSSHVRPYLIDASAIPRDAPLPPGAVRGSQLSLPHNQVQTLYERLAAQSTTMRKTQPLIQLTERAARPKARADYWNMQPSAICPDAKYARAFEREPVEQTRKSGLKYTLRYCGTDFDSSILRRWKREHSNTRVVLKVKFFRSDGSTGFREITEPTCLFYESENIYDWAVTYAPTSWESQEILIRGSCSSRVTYTRTDITDGWTVLNPKSKDNQCLAACFKVFLRRGEQNRTIEQAASCPHANIADVPRDQSDIEALASYYHVFARVFIHGRQYPILRIGNPENPVIDLLREGPPMHYLLITSGTPVHITEAVKVIKEQHAQRKEIDHMTDRERANWATAQMEARTWTDSKLSFNAIVENIVSTSANILIEGAAGVGKSTLANRVCAELRAKHVSVYLTATTGIAACSYLGGMTIDRFIFMNKTRTNIKPQSVLMLDEISIMSAYQFDKLAAFVRAHKMRLIAIGDAAQLPPVAVNEEGYFFQGEQFAHMMFQRVRLDVVRRTQNQEFAIMCNSFRRAHSKHLGDSSIPFEWFDAHYKEDADPREFNVYLAARNETVDEYNAQALDAIDGDQYLYPALMNDAIEPFRCAIGARVMVTRNHMIDGRLIANGMTGTVIECYGGAEPSDDDYLDIHIDNDPEGQLTHIGYIDSTYNYEGRAPTDTKYKFIPLRLAFALTIHKAQGLTMHGRVLVNWDGLFSSSMLYVALTRVTNPDNICFTGLEKKPNIRALYTSHKVSCYLRGLHVDTVVESMTKDDCDLSELITTTARTPINVKPKSDATPYSVLYFDYETSIDPESGNVRPYLCSYVQDWDQTKTERSRERGYMCDIPDDVCPLDKRASAKPNPVTGMVERILSMITEYEEHSHERLAACKLASKGTHKKQSDESDFTKAMRDMRKSLNNASPVLASYNGANFDLYFIMQYILNNAVIDLNKYAIVPVFKGPSLVTFSIINKRTFVRVLRAHDIAQMFVNMSLARACKTFLGDDKDAQKIEFKYEIMDMSKKRYSEWRDCTMKDLRKPVTITVFEDDPTYFAIEDHDESNLPKSCARMTHAREITYVPADVIAYCLRDTDVLPKLYERIGEHSKHMCGLPIWHFLSAGSLTFYCGMMAAKPMLIDKETANIHQRETWREHETELYPLDMTQEVFTRPAVIGGRACSRIISDTVPCVYGDISGMYNSILERGHFPYGAITWLSPKDAIAHVESLKAFAQELSKYALAHNVHPIHLMQMRAAEYFIVDCEFSEYSGLLEPVISARDAHNKTIYTVERRRATLTSIDMLTVLLMGGEVHSVGRMLHFAKAAPYAREWARICMDGKVKYKESNPGLSEFYKLMANAFYGQMMRRDHVDQFSIVAREDQTIDFLRSHEWRYFLMLDANQDILYGNACEDIATFVTSRPTYVGAFVLSYSRVMLMQIIQLVNPLNQLDLQPRVGDTDSLLLPLSRMEALQSFRIDNDQMINELSDIWNAVTTRLHNESFVYLGEGCVSEGEYEATGWFPMNKIDSDGKLIRMKARTGQLADECYDTILKTMRDYHHTKQEYDENTKFAIVEHVFSPAPKVLACTFRDPVSGRLCCKFRAKGVSTSARVNDSGELISAGQLFAHDDKLREENTRVPINATMLDKLKKVGPGSVRASDRMNAGKHLFTIHQYDLLRMILREQWNGRERIGSLSPYTAPYGWIDPNK